jgi:hypothetical protein
VLSTNGDSHLHRLIVDEERILKRNLIVPASVSLRVLRQLDEQRLHETGNVMVLVEQLDNSRILASDKILVRVGWHYFFPFRRERAR